MTENEYKNSLKRELRNLQYVDKVLSHNEIISIYSYKKSNIFNTNEINGFHNIVMSYLNDNKDKYKLLDEGDTCFKVEVLGLEKYKPLKTKLDIKIEELEKELKKLKEKKKQEKEELIKMKRYSIIVKDMEHCAECGRNNVELHECFFRFWKQKIKYRRWTCNSIMQSRTSLRKFNRNT